MKKYHEKRDKIMRKRILDKCRNELEIFYKLIKSTTEEMALKALMLLETHDSTTD